MSSQTGNFTLVHLPHNIAPRTRGNRGGSLPEWMPSLNGGSVAPKCHVALWNSERGSEGAWDTITEREDVFVKATRRAEAEKGGALQSGDTIFLTGKSGNRWKVVVE